MSRLRSLREELGISQNQLSKIWNVSPSSVSQWENGIVEMDYKTLCMAADFYNTSIDFIIGRDKYEVDLSDNEKYIVSEYRNSSEKRKQFIISMYKLADYVD